MYKSNLFTAAEERVLNRLAEYLQMNTNAIVNPNGSIMTVEDMARNIRMDRSDIRKYLRQLVRKNALGVWKSGYDETYFMNPFLYVKGKIEPWLYERFEEEFGAKAVKSNEGKRFKAGKKLTSLVAAV
ncbi:hypothetical protein [Gordoniibacillus kamchatkensis]|uniref:hypothetical protein n=1 Tax=Gordoniibacillus kamchatkensis TaxID=1590651 RepID=UPI000A7B26DE|nr:hypothetical protein [Paenibacillus sp. VKM B-2647]